MFLDNEIIIIVTTIIATTIIARTIYNFRTKD